ARVWGLERRGRGRAECPTRRLLPSGHGLSSGGSRAEGILGPYPPCDKGVNHMPKQLVIVESPTKAKTLERYLGSGFTVTASKGHVRDLPEDRMGVEVDDDFKPE